MMLHRMVAAAGRAGCLFFLALGMTAANATGFCDPGTIILAGTRCHQVRPASAMLDAAAPDGTSSSVIQYSYGELKSDNSVHQIIFSIDVTSMGLGGPEKKAAQLRLFELGLGVMPKKLSGDQPQVLDGRAVTVTILGGDDATARTLQINLMNAPNGASPSLNYSANAAALWSEGFPVPVGVQRVYVYLDGENATQPWKTIEGFVQTDRDLSTAGTEHPFTFPVATGANSVQALYLISGVVAGDVMSGFTGGMVKTTIDYYTPAASDFRN
jgi:hypothetical protein